MVLILIYKKVTKKQRLALSLEDTFFEKTVGGVTLTPSLRLPLPPSRFRLNKGKT